MLIRREKSMRQRFTKILLLAIAFGLMAAPCAFADNVYATIRGTVSDPTGAVVGKVQITATNTETHIAKTATSLDDGSYELLNLPVGTYTISATKQGFKTYKSSSLTVTVNQVLGLPIKLEVGNVSETVEVKANAVQVETTNTQQGTVINSQQITDLPLIGRNFTQLEQLAPGVMSASDRMGTFAVNGSQTQQSSYTVNGTDSNDIALNTPMILPSPDAIQEFNLITSTINPEYGRNSGGIVNALIKNGTNQYHGNAFDFYRDTFLNTHNFFQATTPVFHQNVFGGTIGGPIRKDKTFFFASYQGTRARTAVGQLTSVYSGAERTGNFSADFASLIAQYNTISSATGKAVGAAGVNKTPFGGVIVADNGSVVAAGTPWFNATGTSGGVFNCGTATK